jgi:hypothetical protein
MFIMFKHLALMLSGLAALTGNAAPLLLRPAVAVTNGLSGMDLGSYAIPCVADWNGDGKKDLLVGYQSAWKIKFFANQGSDAEPVFAQSAPNLQADGADIVHTGSGCGSPAPWVCDYDNDGAQDLLVGTSDGKVFFYRNTSTSTQPLLAAGRALSAGGWPLQTGIGSRATPYVHDWNEDGLPDLLSGTGGGNVLLYLNTNTLRSPAYPREVKIQVGGADLLLGIRSVVRVFDWDGDGLKDLVASSDTGVYWCRNTNDNSLPLLQAPVALQVPSPGGSLVSIQTGGRMRLDLADWNNDRFQDIILGNLDGTVVRFEGYRLEVERCTMLPEGHLALTWRSAPYLRYNVLAGDGVTGGRTVLASNLISQGSQTSWTNRNAKCAQPSQFFRVQMAP